jgi:orotate phosphoribosyltransferase
MQVNKVGLDQIQSEILGVIISSGCYSKRDDWVNLDLIWQKTGALEAFAQALAKYLVLYNEKKPFTKVLVCDKVYGAFGILPIYAVCSVKIKIPFIIWKEWARPATGVSVFFGRIKEDDKILILHDVINYGATPTKEAIELKELIEKKDLGAIVGIVSIIDRERILENGRRVKEFIEKRTGVVVESIVTWNDLRRTFNEGV